MSSTPPIPACPLAPKLALGLLSAALLFSTGVQAQRSTPQGAQAAGTANPAALAAAQAGYRLSAEEMYDIANPNKLSHRIFYVPSTGPDAAWFDAVKKGDLATVKKMVAAGQNLEAKDEDMKGQTALGWAAFIGYEDMVRYLVAQGANLFATDRADVKNVLKSAVLGKNVNVVKYVYPLLKNKVNLDEQEDDGETLLMVAASNNRIDIVNYLLSLGVKIDTVSEPYDVNALTYACKRGYQEMAKLLIAAGAVNHKTGKPAC